MWVDQRITIKILIPIKFNELCDDMRQATSRTWVLTQVKNITIWASDVLYFSWIVNNNYEKRATWKVRATDSLQSAFVTAVYFEMWTRRCCSSFIVISFNSNDFLRIDSLIFEILKSEQMEIAKRSFPYHYRRRVVCIWFIELNRLNQIDKITKSYSIHHTSCVKYCIR